MQTRTLTDKQGPARPRDPSNLAANVGNILFLTLIFYLGFISRLLLGPMLPIVESELGIGHTEAGSVFVYLSSGYCLALLGSGFMASWLDHRRTIVISALGVGLGMAIISLFGSLMGIRLGLLVVGLATGLYIPSGIATITSLVDQRHWGKAIAIHEIAPNLSFTTSPLIAEGLLTMLPWQGVLLTAGAASALAGAAFFFWGKGGTFKGQPPSWPVIKGLAITGNFWILTWVLVLAVGCGLGIFTMLPLYLVSEHSLERTAANLWVGISRLTGVGMAFLAGWANDRLGARTALTMALITTGLATILMGNSAGSWLWLALFLQPALVVCLMPPLFAALSQISTPQNRNVTVSLPFAASILVGGGATPAMIGFFGDMGHFGWGISVVGVMTLVALLAIRRLKFNGQA